MPEPWGSITAASIVPVLLFVEEGGDVVGLYGLYSGLDLVRDDLIHGFMNDAKIHGSGIGLRLMR